MKLRSREVGPIPVISGHEEAQTWAFYPGPAYCPFLLLRLTEIPHVCGPPPIRKTLENLRGGDGNSHYSRLISGGTDKWTGVPAQPFTHLVTLGRLW